jgi:F-type H+-transporting ATPase subunit gamma
MRLAEIERRIASLTELERIIGAMRSIASMRAREALRALASVRAYGETIDAAVRDALEIANDPPSLGGAGAARGHRPSARRAIVVCTSEHGFVGGFNERVLEAADARLAPDDVVLVLGSRGASLAAERRMRVVWSHPMATRPASIPQIIRQLEATLYARIARGDITRVEVLFERCERARPPAIAHDPLFPLEAPGTRGHPGTPPRPTRMPLPLHNLPRAVLLERLTAEYVGARLGQAAAESLASENSARFAAMEAAHDNLSHKLEALHLEASGARQEEVTTELLDLVIGEQAATG